jgi:predicted AAA+ superfamily ATPase
VIDRLADLAELRAAVTRSRVVLLTGARQVGKTTLARQLLQPGHGNYFDLEDPADLARLSEPMTALRPLQGLVVIDEVQRIPELFPVLRVLADRDPSPARFLVLGSASPTALRQASESLTGRIELLELGGLRPIDVDPSDRDRLWVRGGYPEPFLSTSDDDARRWHTQHVRNLASRDLPDFGVGLPAATVERFLALVAQRHGQLWNSADPARSLGIAETTVRKYVDVLADALLIRVLLPWFENIGKRQTKSPKVYFRDSGTVHHLLGAHDLASVLRNPLAGATWEGLVIDECLRATAGRLTPYFWRTSSGAELDLLLVSGSKRIGVEVKRADAPTMTPSMRSALADLSLDALYVVYPGSQRYDLAQRVAVVPFDELVPDPAAVLIERGD